MIQHQIKKYTSTGFTFAYQEAFLEVICFPIYFAKAQEEFIVKPNVTSKLVSLAWTAMMGSISK